MSPHLIDADLAAVSDLADRARRTTTVADADAAYRADLVTRYANTRTWEQELALLAEAARYDKQHPGEPSLYEELHATRLGDVA